MSEDWGLAVEAQEKGLSYKVGELTLDKNVPHPVNTSNNAVSAGGSTGGSQSATSPPSRSGVNTGGSQSASSPPGRSGVNTTRSPAYASSGASNAEASANSADEETAPTPEQQSLLRKFLHSKLVTTKTDLEVLRKDPHSPLYSVKSFDALNLKPELLKGVYDMGFNAPSKIQETALPTLLADPPENMIAQSQSGTGKTAAFVLTMLSRVDTSKCYPQCLCLSPTYELAIQTGHVTEMMSKHMPDVSIAYAVRGGERPSRGSHLTNHILIGTPGTVLDWGTQIKAFDLKKIKVFVLDEADVMIATQGHKDQSIRIQTQLNKSCQVLLFSATYDTEVIKFTQKILPNAMTIRLRREEESLANIKQYYIECHNAEEKLQALSNIYGTISIGQSMIFCHTRRNASWLAEKMTKQGHAVALLSGELAIDQRAAVIARFRDGKEKVLITTNVTARGIDVEQVTVVVNFDLPVTPEGHPDCETYLHRIGRTGRFGKAGLAINFIDGQRAMNTLMEIEKHFGRKVERLDADDVDEIEKIGT